MSNNENIQIIIEEAIAVPEGVAVGDYIEAVGVSILEYEYPDEEIEIEYVKQVMKLRVMVERFIEDPEDFCRPCELPNGDISNPLGELFEGFEDLEQTRFGRKIINRMELIAGGTNPILRTQLTEAEKQTNPNYRRCPKCFHYYNKVYLAQHINTDKCLRIETALELRPNRTTNSKKVSAVIKNACYDLKRLISEQEIFKKKFNVDLEVEEYVEGVVEFCKDCNEELADGYTYHLEEGALCVDCLDKYYTCIDCEKWLNQTECGKCAIYERCWKCALGAVCECYRCDENKAEITPCYKCGVRDGDEELYEVDDEWYCRECNDTLPVEEEEEEA